MATDRGGLIRCDNPAAETPAFRAYTTDAGLTSNHVACVTEDQWGQIYVGTGRGVDQIVPDTDYVRHFTTADGLANSSVNVASGTTLAPCGSAPIRDYRG